MVIILGAYEFLLMKNYGVKIDVSRLFIYYNGRYLDKPSATLTDRGCTIAKGVEGLTTYGCCKEELFPYEKEYVNQQPFRHCYLDAATRRAKYTMSVSIDLHEMKGCLAEGFPFIFGIAVFESFCKAETNGGRVPLPNPRHERKYSEDHFHAMLAVGYSDASRCFIVRNSWGKHWVS